MREAEETATARSAVADLRTAACGFCMGAADIVPGVSGGTVALVLRIYERLVGAISRFDTALLGHLRHRRWRTAARHVDLRFLAALGTGILVGIASLSSLLHLLRSDYPVPTSALFFGLIAASTGVVARMVERWSAAAGLALLAGAGAAYALTGPGTGATVLPFGAEGIGELPYTFTCGAIAICAMILPGVSGAYILVLLGRYDDITGAVRQLVHHGPDASSLLTLAVFACGCGVGLLGFSKILRWLLTRAHTLTLALLCGFMCGSLRKLWPFKREVAGDLPYDRWHNRLPESLAECLLPIAVAAGGALLVIALEWFGARGAARRARNIGS